MTAAAIHIAVACEPVSIPLSSQDESQREFNEHLLLVFTGCTPDQVKRYADTEGLTLRRIGHGRGARYVLYLRDWRDWMERRPAA